MTSDLDVYRSAHALIQQHGEAAAIEAAMKADAMLDKGDLEGAGLCQVNRLWTVFGISP